MTSRLVHFAVCLPVLLVAVPSARAEWPDRAVRWVVGFGPGGANDLIARFAAEGVSKRLGQTIVIENRPGAGAVIGTAFVAHSAPDGYTFLVGAASTITNSLMLKDLPYADSDLVPVGMIAVAPSTIVVHPSVPANNMAEFVAWAKAQGNGVNWSTAGNGSTPEFVAEMIKEATGVSFTIVPYKSGGDGVNAVLANNVSATSEASIVVLPKIKAGLLKAIATTYEMRISAYPSITTTAEQGFPTVQIGHWAGLYAPRGTPEPIVQRMNAELQAALKTDEVRGKLIPTGIEPAGGSVADFVNFTMTERERLSELAAKMKISKQKFNQ
jgi:tripartite-type tricarboxylate transporter receptor subunit TctC